MPEMPTSPLVRGVRQSPMPMIEKVFVSLARRVRAGIVHRIVADLPVLVSEVRTTSFASALGALAAPEAKEGEEPVRLVSTSVPDADTAVFAVVRFKPTGAPGFIAFESRLMRGLVQRMLGQEDFDDVEEDAVLTDVELRIANRIFRMVIDAILAEWQDDIPPQVVVEPATNGPRLVDDEDLAMASVVGVYKLGDERTISGKAAVSLPVMTIDRMIDQHSRTEPSPTPRKPDLAAVSNLEIELIARYKLCVLPLARIRSMEVGDEIPLRPSSRCTITANGYEVAQAEVGEAEGSRAIRVVEM